MRIALGLAVVALSTAACTSRPGARAGARAGLAERSPTEQAPPATRVERSAPAPRSYPAATVPVFAAVTGPVDARTLASRNGLAFRDTGDGVLLEGTELRARFYPGSDRMTLDGRTMPMGQAAVRSDGALLVPPTGVKLVDRATADARARRARQAANLASARAAAMRPVAPPAPIQPAVAAARGALPRPSPGAAPGDPAWVPPVPERQWKWVVIHHSDDTSGCASKYHRVHLEKGWENGLGYDFVVGNGTMSGDGEVEVGNRWLQQIQGAHAKTDDNRYNEYGVGIVLVGDFTRDGPTRRQYDACVRLTRWLMARYRITPDRVLRHSDCKPTCCPGPGFPWAKFLADVSIEP